MLIIPKMKLKISNNYENLYIFAAELFRTFEIETTPTKSFLFKIIKSREFNDRYQHQKSIYANSEPDIIADAYKLKFVLKNVESEYTEIGCGRKIMISLGITSNFIHFDDIEFYYLPEGIKIGTKILKNFEEILNHLRVPVQETNVIWRRGNINFDKNLIGNIQDIERI